MSLDADVIQLVLTFVVGVIGVVAGFATLRNQVTNNTKNLADVKRRFDIVTGDPGGSTVFVRRVECDNSTKIQTEGMARLEVELQTQARQLRDVRNFARWWLTQKEGLSIVEVDGILGGDR